MKNSFSLQTHDILRILFSFIALLTDLSRLDLMFTVSRLSSFMVDDRAEILERFAIGNPSRNEKAK